MAAPLFITCGARLVPGVPLVANVIDWYWTNNFGATGTRSSTGRIRRITTADRAWE